MRCQLQRYTPQDPYQLYILDFYIFECPCFWSRTVMNRVDMELFRGGYFDDVLYHCNSAQELNLQLLNFGKQFQAFLTILRGFPMLQLSHQSASN